MKVFVFISLFILSHFLLPAQWQSESGQAHLAWEYAKAEAGVATYFQPDIYYFVAPSELTSTLHASTQRYFIQKIFSYKIHRPIYILLCSFLL